jgi:hypothetical protein
VVTSLKITEDAVEFSNEGELVGKLYKRQMDPENIAAFTKANYNLQGTVKYDAWVAGAFAGLSLLLGEHILGPEDRQKMESTVELTGDGTGQAAAELQQSEMTGLTEKRFVPDGDPIDLKTPAVANEEHGGLTPSRSPENETIVPVSESPADSIGGLTPSRSPEPAAVATPEASGVVSP